MGLIPWIKEEHLGHLTIGHKRGLLSHGYCMEILMQYFYPQDRSLGNPISYYDIKDFVECVHDLYRLELN